MNKMLDINKWKYDIVSIGAIVVIGILINDLGGSLLFVTTQMIIRCCSHRNEWCADGLIAIMLPLVYLFLNIVCSNTIMILTPDVMALIVTISLIITIANVLNTKMAVTWCMWLIALCLLNLSMIISMFSAYLALMVFCTLLISIGGWTFENEWN